MRGAQHTIRNADSSSGVVRYNKLESAQIKKLLTMTELSFLLKEYADQQAKKEAIAFQEWIKKHAYEYDIVKDCWTAIECKTDRNFLCETTEELYELFKK